MNIQKTPTTERIKVILMIVLFTFGFLALISEAESLIWFIATKIIAFVCFIIVYLIHKTLDIWKL